MSARRCARAHRSSARPTRTRSRGWGTWTSPSTRRGAAARRPPTWSIRGRYRSGVLAPADPELRARLLEHRHDRQRVVERHDRRPRAARAHALADLDQLVRIAGAERRQHELLGLVAVEHDPPRVVEARRYLEPPLRPEDPGATGHRALQRGRQGRAV